MKNMILVVMIGCLALGSVLTLGAIDVFGGVSTAFSAVLKQAGTLVALGTITLICLVALAGCSPANACRNYGFTEGTVAWSQCLQNEVLAQRAAYARAAR